MDRVVGRTKRLDGQLRREAGPPVGYSQVLAGPRKPDPGLLAEEHEQPQRIVDRSDRIGRFGRLPLRLIFLHSRRMGLSGRRLPVSRR
jgi:hypothetical protein